MDCNATLRNWRTRRPRCRGPHSARRHRKVGLRRALVRRVASVIDRGAMLGEGEESESEAGEGTHFVGPSCNRRHEGPSFALAQPAWVMQ